MTTPRAIKEAEATNTPLQQPATTTLDPDAHLLPGLDAQPPVGRRKPCIKWHGNPPPPPSSTITPEYSKANTSTNDSAEKSCPANS